MDNLMGPQMPGQTNVNDTWNFSIPRHLCTHLDTFVSALDPSLTFPSINRVPEATGFVTSVLWTR